MGTLDQLITELEQDGTIESEGAFTLDRDKAREKMRQFQLADPLRYVLELVQAAVLKGATKICFDIDADDMRMRFDGEPFTEADFDHVYGSLLSGSDNVKTEARRELALGLNAAMALNPSFIRVESGHGEGGAYLEMRPERDDEYGPLEVAPGETRIHVRQRFRPGLLVQFFKNIAGKLPEERLLKERCCFAPLEIDLEGTRLDGELEISASPATVQVETKAIPRGVMGLFQPLRQGEGRASELPESHVHILKNGVLITTHTSEDLLPGVIAIVEGRALRKDVSQADIVRDARFEELIDSLRERQLDLLARLRSAVEDEKHREWRDSFDPLMRWYLEEVPSIEPLQKLLRLKKDDHRRKLLEVEPWTDLRLRPVSLARLLNEQKTYKSVIISRTSGRAFAEHSERLVVFVAEGAEHHQIERLFAGSVEDWTDRIAEYEIREANRQAWRERPMEPVLPWGSYLARRFFKEDKIAGEVGIRRRESEDLRLDLVYRGCLLVEYRLPLSIIGLHVVVEADFDPNEPFDDVVRNEKYGKAMVNLLEAVPRLFADLAKDRQNQQWHRACLSSYLETLCGNHPFWDVLEQLEVEKETAKKLSPIPPKTWLLPNIVRHEKRRNRHLLRLPLIPTWDGGWLSIFEIEEELVDHGHIRAVSEQTPCLDESGSVSTPLRRAAERMAYDDAPEIELKRSNLSRPILILSDTARKVLAAVDHKWRHVSFDQACTFLSSADRYMERLTLSPRIAGKVSYSVEIDDDEIEGELALLSIDDDLAREGEATLLLHDRRLGEMPLGIPLDGLTAIAAHDDLLPRTDWDGARENDDTRTVRQALARTLPRLVNKALPHAADPIDLTARWFLCSVARALFPSEQYRRAYENLREHSAPGAAETSYLRILELAASVSFAQIGSLLHKTLAGGRSLNVEDLISKSVRRLGKSERDELGITLESAKRGRFYGRPGVLSWLEALFPIEKGSGRTPTCGERVLAPLPELFHAAIFTKVDGQPATLGDVLAEHRKRGKIHYLRDRPPKGTRSRRLRLLAKEQEERRLLECIFGKNDLLDDRAWLASCLKKHNIERLKSRQSQLELGSGEALVSVQLRDDGLEGEVGLPSAYPRRAATLGATLCKERHEVGFKEAQSPIPLVAILDDESIEMSLTWDRIEQDSGGEARLEACRLRLPALALALCEKWPRLVSERHRSVARKYALDLLVLQGKWSLKNMDREGDEAWTQLCTLPLLNSVNGIYHSVSKLARRQRDQDEPVCYVTDHSARGEPLEKGKIVLALSDFELQRLLRLTFLKSKDHSAEWRREREIVVWRMTAQKLPKKGELPALHRSDEGLPPGFEGELVIPNRALDQKALEDLPTVSFGAFGHVVENRSISEVLPCGGTLSGPGLEIERHFRWVKLEYSQKRALEGAVGKLYESLCDKYASDRFPSEDPGRIIRSYLAAAVVLIVREKKTHVVYYREIFKKLRNVPLLDLSDGRAVSWDVARKERPHDLNHLGLWQSKAHEVETRVASKKETPERKKTAPPAVPKPAPPPPKKKEAPWEKPSKLQANQQREELAKREQVCAVTPTEPEPPSREELLLEVLREELQLVRDANKHLLSDVNLELLRFEKLSKKLAVLCDERGTHLNPGHPMVQVVLEQFDRDRIWVTFLASAVYSAINHRLAEVTDDQEARFHHELTSLTVTCLGRVR